jgi:hypothetical protein
MGEGMVIPGPGIGLGGGRNGKPYTWGAASTDA